MAGYSKVIAVGNLTRDPEYTEVGSGLCKLGLAINESWKDRSGDWQEKTCFVDVTLWGKSAEGVSGRFKKGDSILVDGTLQLEQWDDKDGKKRSRHTIKAMTVKSVGGERVDNGGGVKRDSNGRPEAKDEGFPTTPAVAAGGSAKDDDLPF
jgi:single-strand DNA-binding protein